MSSEAQQLRATIAGLELQRALLGDTVVEAALGPLRNKLAALHPLTPEPGPAQSLRQVSILFLDVVGSTALAQSLDPEDVSAVMDGVLARGTALVQAHRGRVLQYAGDNLLAAFGADVAAEDDAERAVRCGLSLLELGKALGSEVLQAHGRAGLDVRVGIHTGGVLLGGGVDEDGSIRGQAVNIAARMEQTAPPGGLRISRDTHDQVRGLFDVTAAEPLVVKGVDDPVLTYLVLKVKPRGIRVAQRGIEGVATRMIGREGEFEALQDAFKRLFDERQLMAVSVVAEAGIGKSRLLSEFEGWSEGRPERFSLFRGRTTPQTQGQPFGLLRDIVASRFHLSDDDSLGQAKAKIEQGVMPLFVDEPEFAQGHAHLLGHLIGLDWKESPHLRNILQDPKQIRNRAQHAAAQVFRRVSEADGSPIVLQLEDLHWADDESLDFLNYLAEVDRDVPLLLLAFTRPVLFERRTDWPATELRHLRIDLQPLDKRASRDLTHELLKKLPEVPAALRELITHGAEGNPFYMEELVRMLIDQGAIDIAGDAWQLNADRLLATKVPPTLTGVLQARLDGLPAAERLTLQEASVIGQVFWDKALVALNTQAETTLPRLVRRELTRLRQEAGSDAPDGLREYAFQHALLHQVTYGTVLRRRRKAMHAKLAEWLAAQSEGGGARAGDFLGLTAQHYAEAGDDANAAEFHVRAAEHAAGRLAHATALEHVHKALALLDRAGEHPKLALLRWRLLTAREQTLEVQGERERQAADLDAMDRLAEALGDGARRAYAAYRRAYRALRLADWPQCERSALQAVAYADAALASLGAVRAGSDDLDELQELRLLGLRLLGHVMITQGRFDDAEAQLRQTLDEASERALLKAKSFCLNSLAVLAAFRNDLLQGLALSREGLALARERGDRRTEAIDLSNVGGGWLTLGDLAAARRDLEESLRLTRQNGDRALECGPLCNLSGLALYEGDEARALTLARSGLETAVAVQARHWEAFAAYRLGDAEAALGRPEQAAQAYARAGSVAQEFAPGLRFDAIAGLARLALAKGDIAGAMGEIQPLLAQVGNAGDGETAAGGAFEGAERPRWIELSVHRVLAAAGDPRADAWLERAYRTLQAKAGSIGDEGLRQMFLANIPSHREIVALREQRRSAS